MLRRVRRGMLGAALLGTLLAAGPLGAEAQATGAAAPSGTVTGNVARCLGNASQQPLPFARVSESSGLAVTLADQHGQFALSLPPGQYLLLVGDSAAGTAAAYAVAVAASQDVNVGTLAVGPLVAGCATSLAPVVPSTATAAAAAAAQPASSGGWSDPNYTGGVPGGGDDGLLQPPPSVYPPVH